MHDAVDGRIIAEKLNMDLIISSENRQTSKRHGELFLGIGDIDIEL